MKEIDFIDKWLYHIIKYLSSFVPCSHHLQEKIVIFLNIVSCVGCLSCYHHHGWLELIYGIFATINIAAMVQKHRESDDKRRMRMIRCAPSRVFGFIMFLLATFLVIEVPVPICLFFVIWTISIVIIDYLTLETIPPKTKKDKLPWKEIVKMFGTTWMHTPLHVPNLDIMNFS